MSKTKPTYKELQEQLTRSKREITKLRTNNKKLEDEKKHNEARRESLIRLSQIRTKFVQELFEFALKEVVTLTGSKYGYIYRYDEYKKKFELISRYEDVINGDIVIGQNTINQIEEMGILSRIVQQAKPIIIDDFQAAHSLENGHPEGHTLFNNIMIIPISIDRYAKKVVCIANKETGYNDNDLSHSTSFMNSALRYIERYRMEEALEISESRYRRLFETAQDGILILDACTEQITDANPFLIEMLGYTKENILGKRLWEIGTIKDKEASKTAFSELQNKGYVRYEVLPLEAKDGRLINVEFVSNSYMVDNKKVIQCNIRDITDRKRAEDELYKAKNMMEELVRARTAQVRAITLELTRVEQRERNRLAEVIHDNLQQLLVGAKWGIQATQKKDMHDDLRKSLERTAELMDESIRISRLLVAELSPPILHNEGLVAAIKWLATWMQETYGIDVEIKSEIEINSESGGTSYLLFQSVRELLLNIIKHSQVKTALISIDLLDNHIQIIVSDKGVGFDFNHVTKQGPEVGFGLFNMRERLELIGGDIAIDSAPGIGTSVSIIAPLPKQDIYSKDNNEQEAFVLPDNKNIIQADGHNLKIRVLVADDHKIMREGLCGLLRSVPDIEVVGEAFDGDSAVKMARQLRPNIVIMDVNMPGMNGIEATRHITSEMPDIKVIGLSMIEDADGVSAMLNAGAADYIHKAGPSQELIASIMANYRTMPLL